MYDDSRYTNDMIRSINRLSKYLTPEYRFKLVKTCIRGILKKREKHPDQTYRKGAAYELAEMIGVEKNTVLRWMAHGIQGNNKNIFKLIMISLDHAKNETLNLLEEGLKEHYDAFYKLESEIKKDVTFDYL